jgi:integrase
MITDIRAALDHMPMPERLRRRRTPEEMERLEAKRDAELKRWEERKPGQPGPKPKRSIEELSQPIDEWAVPALRTRMLRHSWAAARLQTLDHGAPVSIYTVGQEMGHVDIKMLKHIYAHLGEIRVRGEEVAFRW